MQYVIYYSYYVVIFLLFGGFVLDLDLGFCVLVFEILSGSYHCISPVRHLQYQISEVYAEMNIHVIRN